MLKSDNEIQPVDTLLRFVDENGWEWRTVVKMMNRMFDGNYSIDDLKSMYETAKTVTFPTDDGTIFGRR